jgi:hypothetical protein
LWSVDSAPRGNFREFSANRFLFLASGFIFIPLFDVS